MANEDSLQQFGAYQKACALFDFAVADLSQLGKQPLTMRLVSQQIATADSIAANIEEGYGRRSRKDYAHFLVIARGSAAETITVRVALCEEIVAILSATIRRLREEP